MYVLCLTAPFITNYHYRVEMLNRRLLRTKAVQALYASRLAADSNRLLALDEIAEQMPPC